MPRLSNQQLALKVQEAEEAQLLKDRGFRRFLFRLFRDSGMFRSSYRRGHSDDTAFEEGRRALGLELLDRLKRLEPGLLGLLEAEGNLLDVKSDDTAQTSEDDDELSDP